MHPIHIFESRGAKIVLASVLLAFVLLTTSVRAEELTVTFGAAFDLTELCSKHDVTPHTTQTAEIGAPNSQSVSTQPIK